MTAYLVVVFGQSTAVRFLLRRDLCSPTNNYKERPMIPKLICWFFGHKLFYEAFTGETAVVDGVFDKNITVPIVRREKSRYCFRCGQPQEL